MPVVKLPILIMVALILLIALFAWYIGTRRSKVRFSDETRKAIGDARIDPGEREASLIAEQIEETVRRSLNVHPDLAATKLDFGTGPDGGLMIWVDDNPYPEVAAIPDARIREAVEAAVKQFNA